MFVEWSIDISLFNWMVDNISPGKTILELGSGHATENLAEIWKMYSIEENWEWMNIYNSTYIYAPITDNWYDTRFLIGTLPQKVDVILIDGPAYGDRNGFFWNIERFMELKPSLLIFDDIARVEDNKCYNDVLNYLKERYRIETDTIIGGRKFGYINIYEKVH